MVNKIRGSLNGKSPIKQIHQGQQAAALKDCGKNCGKVWLVGAGPGDPGLLTVKALQAIQQADVILLDRLVSEAIRALIPTATQVIYVGKAKSNHSIPQVQLNQLLVHKASQGLNVCRLKGGDAFIFGRGGEEMLELKAAGIQVEVIPGITAASGCSSYAGIPLTHRGISQGCTFVTGHGEKELAFNWHSLAGLNHTLVFYMGLGHVQMISEQLIAAGLIADTPAALIEKGCTPQQRVVRGTIDSLPELAQREQVKSPALIVIGEVVNLAEQLQWLTQQVSDSDTSSHLTNSTALNKLSA